MKRAVALTSVAGFAVVVALARQGHPATGTSKSHTVSASNGSSSASLTWQSGSQRSSKQLGGGGSLAPSLGGSPLASSHTS